MYDEGAAKDAVSRRMEGRGGGEDSLIVPGVSPPVED
jgi:hypothetical protein